MQLKPRILIIDDEVDFLEVARGILARHFEISVASDPIQGLQLARTQHPEVILLDVMMPQINGLRICEELRSDDATRHIRILMVSGAPETGAKLGAFERGADDFIHKPFNYEELVARIQAIVRRMRETKADHAILAHGNLKIDLDAIQVTVGEKPIGLDMREFEILTYFVRNPGRALSRKQILESVWRDTVVSERTVDRYIGRIRGKLEGCDHDIATIQKAGYRLCSKTFN